MTSAEFLISERFLTVKVKRKDQKALTTFRSRLLMSTGYYDYDKGYTPEFKETEEF
jgi:cation diffusion facilitator CzcD-associated flavoprotein CzcO